MVDILSITAPVFIIIACGYAYVRYNLLSKEHARGLSKFVISFALPVLVFMSFSSRSLTDIIIWPYFLAYAAGSFASYLFSLIYTLRVLKEPLSAAALHGFGSSLANSSFIGFALLTIVIGEQASVYFALNLLVENILVIPLTLILCESQGSRNQSMITTFAQILKNLATNPIIIALVLGLMMSLLGWRLPEVLDRTGTMLAGASGPIALFAIGGALYGITIKGDLHAIAYVTGAKLLLHPLFVFVAMQLIPNTTDLDAAVGVLSASIAMASIFPALGMRYGFEDRTAATLMITTVLSFFSITLALSLFFR